MKGRGNQIENSREEITYFVYSINLNYTAVWVHSPEKAGLETHWPKRFSHSRSGSPLGLDDPTGEEFNNTKVKVLIITIFITNKRA